MKTLLTLYFALKDERTPWYAKMTALLSIIYLLSPADLVPDIIPFAGYLDDVVVVPFLLNISNRLLPQDVRRMAEQKALKNKKKIFWLKIILAVAVIGLLVLLFLLASRWYQHLR